MMIENSLCWFCGQQPCPDQAHLALEIILFLGQIAIIVVLIFFVIWLASCVEHTAASNKQTWENYQQILYCRNRLAELEGKIFAIDEANKPPKQSRIKEKL